MLIMASLYLSVTEIRDCRAIILELAFSDTLSCRVEMAIIPMSWKVPWLSRVIVLRSTLSATHCVKVPDLYSLSNVSGVSL